MVLWTLCAAETLALVKDMDFQKVRETGGDSSNAELKRLVSNTEVLN